jgi:Carboxypeptidase regulatory-like domain
MPHRCLPFTSVSRTPVRSCCLILLCLSSVAAVSGRAASPDKKAEKPYALIYGTVWGPDSRPLYGVKVRIRRADQKKARWQLYSDHRGEFAQRVLPGPADYVVGADLKGYKTQDRRTLRLPEEVKVHVAYDEREDIGVHLTY